MARSKEQNNQYGRNFRALHPGYGRTYHSAWRLANQLRNRWHHLKDKARQRGIAVLITYEQFIECVAGKFCAYCGGELPHAGSGIDRVDHSKPYMAGNIVPCCTVCNTKKGRLEGLGFTSKRSLELLKELASAD